MLFDEPVNPNDYKDLALLDSAVNRPFQTFGGEDLYGTIYHKAAALFHSIICNHCFTNGNKRTALMAIDLFLAANGHVLLSNNKDMYNLAKRTASTSEDGRKASESLNEIYRNVENESISLDLLRSDRFKSHENIALVIAYYEQSMAEIRSDPRNQPQESGA